MTHKPTDRKGLAKFHDIWSLTVINCVNMVHLAAADAMASQDSNEYKSRDI